MTTAETVFEVTDHDFQEKVLLASREVPVAVDFYADWCQPCKVLAPILEKVVGEFQGTMLLAKIDVDKNPQVSGALRIQSMPTVVIFRDGQPVDGFQGAQPENVIRELLSKHAAAPEADPFEVAQAALAAGDHALAQQAFEVVISTQPTNGDALLGLARIAIATGDVNGAATWLDRIGDMEPAYAQAVRLRGLLSFGEFVGDAAALRAKVAADPKDVESWYALGATLALSGDTDGGLDAFLKVVSTDREFREDGGREALLSMFDLLGTDDPAVLKYRRRLATLLF
jgi:putative thioredoxin